MRAQARVRPNLITLQQTRKWRPDRKVAQLVTCRAARVRTSLHVSQVHIVESMLTFKCEAVGAARVRNPATAN